MNSINNIALKIDWATHEAAKFACVNWHYSKSTPVPPLVKIGVWENNKFIGVVIFSRGASPSLLKPYMLKQTEGCELSRIALTKHITPVSRIVRIAIAFLKKKSPELRLIISFADPFQSHHGGVYQAGNWLYAGETAKAKNYMFNGKKLHLRQVSEKGFNIQQGKIRKTAKPSECEIIVSDGKHRYLMPLDAQMKEQIKVLAKPYPKRLTRTKEQAIEYPSMLEGATPICTLQT